MGKLVAVGLVFLLLFAITLILIDEQLSVKEYEQAPDSEHEQKPQDAGTSQTSGFVELKVDGDLVDDFWERGTDDLPVLTVAVNYIVENVGNVSAEIVTVELALDAMYYSTKTVYDLQPNSGFTDSISFSVDYDQPKTLEIEASYDNVTAYWSYTVDAELPRQPSWGMSKLFITPDEKYVESAYKEIMSGVFFVNWMAIRDWVGRNVEYVSDYDSYAVGEYWQLGKETLESRTGDCEDFAILLCSLLRADGWSTEGVYVVVGQNEAGDYHAWVKIKIPWTAIWYNIDPQQDGWYTGPGDIITLYPYTAIYNFNDQYFIEL
ncbi:MAG: transglutaminase-like domain-containing protein [Candidatus Bathyarchaeota archaeon]|nr:transglutaminase-like domain-containing protein [Candidatus Bathyarchaeota archaeon]